MNGIYLGERVYTMMDYQATDLSTVESFLAAINYLKKKSEARRQRELARREIASKVIAIVLAATWATALVVVLAR